VRVRYADTDAMGVVYHGNFLAFFETGRVEAMRQIGVSYAEVVKRGMHLVVVSASVRYRRSAVFDDLLLVSTRVSDKRGASFAFDYRVTRESDDALIATGRTEHACVDSISMRPVRLPQWLDDELDRLS
jgi:acyl-CoA thioester hydrolase